MLEDDINNVWTQSLTLLGLEDATMLSKSRYDFSRRTYVKKDVIYKILLLNHDSTSALRNQSLADELAIVKHCTGTIGVPEAVDYRRIGDVEVAVYEHIPFKSLDQVQVGLLIRCAIFCRLLLILFKVSLRGVSHNDIVPSNILVSDDGKPFLIDFDQAKAVSPGEAVIRNLFGVGNCIWKTAEHTSLVVIVKKYTPPHVRQALHRLRENLRMRPKRQLPKLPENASRQVKSIFEAWKAAQLSAANAPGKMVSYYSLEFDGCRFPGERPWLNRWLVLKRISDFHGKRILELGCNLGILSCFLLKEARASTVLAVDHDANILRAAKKVSSAFGVWPIYMRTDFDDPDDWETDLINFKPDIVFALSVLNWVNDKNRFMSFLGKFQEVIFEGHDSIDEETKRFGDLGFESIEMVAVSERNRPILHCLKKDQ